MALPTDRLYTKQHEWAKFDGTTATVGITDYAQSSLGDIVYVELPKPGAAVTRAKAMGVVESVKAVSDIFAPVSGTVAEVNAEAQDDPGKVNRDPFGAGWLVKIAVADAGERDALLSAPAYQQVIDAERH